MQAGMMEFIGGFLVGVIITVICVLWFMEGFIKIVQEIIRETR